MNRRNQLKALGLIMITTPLCSAVAQESPVICGYSGNTLRILGYNQNGPSDLRCNFSCTGSGGGVDYTWSDSTLVTRGSSGKIVAERSIPGRAAFSSIRDNSHSCSPYLSLKKVTKKALKK